MTDPLDYHGKWKTMRWSWKKAISRSPDLSSAEKHFAAQLCDSFANSKSACVWARNDTLAEHFSVKIRTIQRHLAGLKTAGFIRNVRIRKKRRAVQLVFPPGLEHDTEHDMPPPRTVTQPSPEHDNPVTPYKEPRKNQGKAGCDFYVLVGVHEHQSIAEWKTWIAENLEKDPETVLETLRTKNEYMLPHRFPREAEADAKRYRAFFGMHFKVGEPR